MSITISEEPLDEATFTILFDAWKSRNSFDAYPNLRKLTISVCKTFYESPQAWLSRSWQEDHRHCLTSTVCMIKKGLEFFLYSRKKLGRITIKRAEVERQKLVDLTGGIRKAFPWTIFFRHIWRSAEWRYRIQLVTNEAEQIRDANVRGLSNGKTVFTVSCIEHLETRF